MNSAPKHSLDKGAIAAINKALDTLLDQLSIQDGFPSLSSWIAIDRFKHVLTRHEPWQSHFETFELYESISRVIERHFSLASVKENRLLKDLLDPETLKAIRDDLKTYLLSFPRDYELWIELPSMPKWGSGELPISHTLALAETTRLGTASDAKGDTVVYVRARTKGYGAGRFETTAVSNAISDVKQFFQLFRRLPQFSYRRGLIGAIISDQKSQAVLIDPGFTTETMTIRLPTDIQTFTNTASIDEEKLETYDHSKASTLLGGEMRPASTRAEKESALGRALVPITRLLNCPRDTWIDAQRIRTALEWSFDSEQNDNQTLSFIQACVGLEALVGDDDQDEPLVSRLADRVAYLLGQNHEDRIGIRKRFRTIYDIRSKIIHGRRARLKPADASELYLARGMLGDVITEETNRLLRALTKREEATKV